MHARVESTAHPILDRLAAALGAEHVVTDIAEREFYSTDIYRAGRLPIAVVRPGTPAEVAEVVKLAAAHDLPVVARGGGASYTDGYAPAEVDAVLVDTSRLSRIVEINERDMFAIVEAGVTWAALNDALRAKDLRTPFFGPFSGLAATVGGGLSQGAVSWGTGQFGVSGENVLGVEVVTAGGEFVRTGTWAAANSVPFFRSYGPDLTGLFMGDCGALGVKTRVALRLMRRSTHVLGLSFGFRDFESMAGGMEAAAKEGLAIINFGLDPTLQQGQLGKATVSTGLASAAAVFRTSRNLVDGVAQVARIGLAGRGFLKGATFSAHWLVDGVDATAARAHAARLRSVLQPHGAEVANTVPTVANAMPFMPLYNVRGPKGERWVPIHGILPFSRVTAFRRDLLAYYTEHDERMKRHQVVYGAMFMTVSTHAFLYEPVFYWHDVANIAQERLAPEGYVKSLPQYPDNPQGRALVDEMKHGIADIFQRHGAAHMQIGKFYPYLRGREASNAKLLREVKALVDPRRRLNPGALGL
jgi:FAD/FMN-containing dehydrogenase